MIPKNKEEAGNVAKQHLSKVQVSPPAELVIVDEHTIETDFGCVFFWNSKKYLETGDYRADRQRSFDRRSP